MYYLKDEFLREKERFVSEQAGGLQGFSLSTAEGPMDRVLIEFTEDGLSNVLPLKYDSEERFSFYLLQYWQVTAPFLLRLRNRFPNIRGKVFMWIDDVCRQPGLVYTLTPGLDQFGIPDPYYLRSNGYESTRRDEITFEAWQQRGEQIFWRGSSTGYRTKENPTWRDLPRFKLCAITHERTVSHLFDIGVSNIVQMDSLDAAEINASGFVLDKVPQDRFEAYRATVDIDGNANSWDGPFKKLQFGNTLLKVNSEYNYSQWFYPRFVPWKHYIPIEASMEDLVEKAHWVRKNPVDAFEIALNGQRFANELTYENVLEERGNALIEYLSRAPCRDV
ncbi:MAG: hypothetical protein K2Y16_08930 [Burkholderiales bacterium]|nr:hypothetical protein [Burkholderiales bacterium]